MLRGSDQAQGLIYQTAQEESDGPGEVQAKRAAKPKRVTTAQLAR